MLNKQKTFFPQYSKLEFELWKKHIEKKIYSENKNLGISSSFFELLSFLSEKYGYQYFDYLIAGDDPLLSLIVSIEKISKGKRVLIYPTKAHDAPLKLNSLMDERLNLISQNVVNYLNSKYNLRVSSESGIHGICVALCSKINEQENKLCFLYDGLGLYSFNDKSSVYDNKQVFWHRDNREAYSPKWNKVERHLNKLNLLNKDKKNKQVNSFITANQVILTTRTSRDFCDSYLKKPIAIGDSLAPIEMFSTFGIKERLIDILSAMSISNIEKNNTSVKHYLNMYGNLNEQ